MTKNTETQNVLDKAAALLSSPKWVDDAIERSKAPAHKLGEAIDFAFLRSWIRSQKQLGDRP